MHEGRISPLKVGICSICARHERDTLYQRFYQRLIRYWCVSSRPAGGPLVKNQCQVVNEGAIQSHMRPKHLLS